MINPGGSGTVPAGLPQGETEGFYMKGVGNKRRNTVKLCF